jgi:carbamoyl-phosphate synthase large subunit
MQRREGAPEFMSSRQDTTTVLITGVGDTVGQALIKTARQSALPCRVLGTDRDAFSVGLHWVDAGFILPHCSHPDAYLAEIRRICVDEGAQLILPGSEVELELLSRNADALLAETGAIVVASKPDVLRVAMDKWETCRFLERSGLNFPRFARGDSPEEIRQLVAVAGFPLIAKPMRGTGARGVVKIKTWSDLDPLIAGGVPMVVQEYLQPDDEEYSVEVYTLQGGRQAGAICYRRGQLIAGDTYRAQVMQHEAVQMEARSVAAALGSSGPCNVQLRVTERGPVTFEINPRFSGGVSMRAHFGYNEIEMAIRDLVRGEPVPPPKVTSGRALRYWEEAYVDDAPETKAVPDAPRAEAIAMVP